MFSFTNYLIYLFNIISLLYFLSLSSVFSFVFCFPGYFSFILSLSIFLYIFFKSIFVFGHSNIICLTVLFKPGAQMQNGFSLHLKRCKYSENPPCPVSICVVVPVISSFLNYFVCHCSIG